MASDKVSHITKKSNSHVECIRSYVSQRIQASKY